MCIAGYCLHFSFNNTVCFLEKKEFLYFINQLVATSKVVYRHEIICDLFSVPIIYGDGLAYAWRLVMWLKHELFVSTSLRLLLFSTTLTVLSSYVGSGQIRRHVGLFRETII